MNKKYFYSLFASLLVLTVLALCIFPALLGGLGAFERVFANTETAFDARTCVGYIYTHIRSCDAPDNISVTDFSGGCLEIPDENGEYITKIYCFDGWLCELYCENSGEFEPLDGEKIIRLESIAFEEKNGLLKVNFGGREVYVNLVSEVQYEE